MKKIISMMLSLFLLPSVWAESDSLEETLKNEFNKLISFLFDQTKQILDAFFDIFEYFFGGIADSLRNALGGLFDGAKGAMDSAWGTMTDSLEFAGPFAPMLAMIIIFACVYIAIQSALLIMDSSVDYPGEDELED